MPRNATRYYPQTTLYDGVTLNVVCHRPAHGPPILRITNRTDLKQVRTLYGQRGTIETTFAGLKSRGFNLQDTHRTHPQRLHLLMGVLAWTLLWTLLVGLQLQQRKPTPRKNTDQKPSACFGEDSTNSPKSYIKNENNLNTHENMNIFYCRVPRVLSIPI